jgi:ribosomal protein S7
MTTTSFIIKQFLKKKIFIKFVNILMCHGQKTKAEFILYQILTKIKNTKQNPLITLIHAIKNVSPVLILKKLKRRKKIQIIPRIISKKKQLNYGIVSLIKNTKKNKKIKMHLQLYEEIITASNNTGYIVDLKKQIYTSAFENKLLLKFNRQIN